MAFASFLGGDTPISSNEAHSIFKSDAMKYMFFHLAFGFV